MKIHRSVGGALAAAVALTLLATAKANAQDTTRRVTSEQRIPVRKDAATTTRTDEGVTRRTAGGDVRLPPTMERIDSLEALAASYRTRIDSLERTNVSLASRLDATDRLIAALRDSLNTVRGELASAREELTAVHTELTATTARAGRIADSLVQLNSRFNIFKNRSIFGNSGFYLGLGSGTTMPLGTLRDIDYRNGDQIVVPLGWHKPGNMLGLRTEWAWQDYNGRGEAGNLDPRIYTATAMLSLHFPFNAAKTHDVYAMGGGGIYHFRHLNRAGALGVALSDTDERTNSETKFGVVGGVGVQFHILGATSLFAQTTFNHVSANQVVAPASGKSLHWVPLTFGFTIR